MTDELDRVVQVLKAGNDQVGQQLLLEYVQNYPDDERGWIWMGALHDDFDKKVYCIQKALQLNPDNEVAQTWWRSLQEQEMARKAFVPPIMAESPRRHLINDFPLAPLVETRDHVITPLWPETKLVLCNSRPKAIGYLILSSFFAVILSFAFKGGDEMAGFGFLLNIGVIIIAIYRFIDQTPKMVIDEQGITDHRKQWVIPWSAVAEMWVQHFYRSNYVLSINFKDRQRLDELLSPEMRMMNKVDEWCGTGQIRIAFSGLSKSTEAVWSHIQYLKLHGYIEATLR